MKMCLPWYPMTKRSCDKLRYVTGFLHSFHGDGVNDLITQGSPKTTSDVASNDNKKDDIT